MVISENIYPYPLSRLDLSDSGLTPLMKGAPTPPMELILIGFDLENLLCAAGELEPDPGAYVALLPDGGVISSFFLKLSLSRMLTTENR